MTSQQIYNEMSRVLTDYEGYQASPDDLYRILVKIQNNWEAVITAWGEGE